MEIQRNTTMSKHQEPWANYTWLNLSPHLLLIKACEGVFKEEWARNKLKQEKGLNTWGSEEQTFLGLLT